MWNNSTAVIKGSGTLLIDVYIRGKFTHFLVPNMLKKLQAHKNEYTSEKLIHD